MATGIQINGTDIEELLERTRDNPDYSGGVVDITPTRPSPFANSGITQSNSSLTPLTNFFVPHSMEHSTYGTFYVEEGFDISPYIPSITDSLTRKGYRPRINPYIRKLVFEKDGTSTRRYYVIKKRETKLQVYESTSLSSGYNLIQDIPASVFPEGKIPNALYFFMCGGGGGAEGGALSDDGQGGGGGAVAFGFVYLTSSEGALLRDGDFIFTIQNGGAGGGVSTDIFSKRGYTGSTSLLYRRRLFMGNYDFMEVVSLAGGVGAQTGYGGDGGLASNPTNSVLVLTTSKGGYGLSNKGYTGSHHVSISTIVFDEIFSHYSSGGGEEGGGGSIGFGGIDSSRGDGQSGYRGGGGGGGGNGTIFKKGGDGGNGGNGYFALYY